MNEKIDWRKLPRKKIKKTGHLRLRITPAEHDAIRIAADKTNKTITDFVMDIVRKNLPK